MARDAWKTAIAACGTRSISPARFPRCSCLRHWPWCRSFHALVWSTLPLTLYFGLRRYQQSMHIVKPVVFALVSANLVNLAGNWVLVYGHFGLRARGVAGSGWSTCVSRIYLVVVLALAAVYYDRKRSSGLW